MTVTVPREATKPKLESRGESPRPKRPYKGRQQIKGPRKPSE